MKKFLCSILIIVLNISCFGCTSTTTVKESDAEPTIENTTDPTTILTSANVSEEETQPSTENEEVETTTEDPTTTEPTTVYVEPTTVQPTTTQPTTTQPTTVYVEPTTEEPTTQAITMTASTTNITLGETPQSSYITVTGYSGSINYIISGIEVISCKWGANSGENNETIELIFTPLSSGTATVYAYLVDADKGITFNITVNKEDPHNKTNLTINGIGGEYKYWTNNKQDYNNYKINNAVYEKVTNNYGTVDITVTVTASCIEQNLYGIKWIIVNYKLYNSDGIVIKSDNISIANYSLFELYQTKITFKNLEPGDYILCFTETN